VSLSTELDVSSDELVVFGLHDTVVDADRRLFNAVDEQLVATQLVPVT